MAHRSRAIFFAIFLSISAYGTSVALQGGSQTLQAERDASIAEHPLEQTWEGDSISNAVAVIGGRLKDLFGFVAFAQTGGGSGCPPDAIRLGRECATRHAACRGDQCVLIPEPGENECVKDGDCPVRSRRACIREGLGAQCAIVRGPGEDECETDADCKNQGGGGSTGTCSDRDGDGEYDTCVAGGPGTIGCITDSDCTRKRHTACSTNEQCVVRDGPGINECGSPWNPDNKACSCPNLPPSKDNCGEYSLNNNPLGANFGDPICAYSKTRLRNYLNTVDPRYAHRWFCQIIPCESGYNPNSWGPGPNHDTLACRNKRANTSCGVWGLYQMDCHILKSCSPNNQFDINDVIWCQQTQNAVSYNNLIGNSFGYWACNDDPYVC